MQNGKKLVIMIAVAFGIAVIISFIMLFSVKKVAAEFSVYGASAADEIQSDLESFKGRSILFVKEKDVRDIVDKYPYYEIKSVKREYPNVLRVSVVKRVEAFRIIAANKTCVIDSVGNVLNDTGATEEGGRVIDLDLGELTVVYGVVGDKIKTSDDVLFYSVLKTCRALNLSDSVKNAKIDNESGRKDAVFTTYTGVGIEVWNVDDDGEEKINKAFGLYESLCDYEKTANRILSFKKNDGTITAEWTSR